MGKIIPTVYLDIQKQQDNPLVGLSNQCSVSSNLINHKQSLSAG